MPETILRLCSSSGEAWEEVIRDWLRATASTAWQRALPSLVVVPTRSHAQAFKARMLQVGESHLGLHFVTPAGLRQLVAVDSNQPSASSREHLRLLLALAAEEALPARIANPLNPETQAAQAVLRAPNHLLGTLDRLEAAGWEFDDLPLLSFQPIVRRFRKSMRSCGFDLTARLDRSSADRAHGQPAKISHLLIAGFDGAHWPLWFLLQAAVHAAERSVILLMDRREEGSDLDETWIGTWEQNFGPAQPVAARSDTVFPELFAPEISGPDAGSPSVEKHFLVGRTVSDQAKAIAALVECFLASGSSERIGVLFPAAGALPRAVSRFLSDAKIPHHDGIAHLAPGPLEDGAWPAWLELQESPRLRILLRFLRASPAAGRFFAPLPVDRVEDILRRASRNLLMDDLHLLGAYCANLSQSEGVDRVVTGLKAIRFLPERTSFSAFLAQSFDIFDSLSWRDRRAHLEQAAAGWAARVVGEFSRASYLRWLAEVSTSIHPERDRDGDHPYGRVQLLFYSHAEGQTWSHLILTGLNEGSWPARPNESGFLDEHDIAAFNAGMQKLNRRALRQGSQGEGHSIMAAGRTFYLGPVEQRALSERQFQNLRESATVAIGASASLIEETAPERFANPSEFFTRLYLEKNGRAPGQATMAALEKETARWLARRKEAPPPADSDDIAQTAVAYRARNQPEVGFGEYEFALREPLPRPLTLSATDCERIIKAPALVWLKKFLGVEARDDDLANWNIAIGQWVHDWLRQVAPSEGEFIPRPSAKDVRRRVQKAARQFRAGVHALLGRPLPDWWTSAWNQAAFIADTLAEIITTTEDWSHFATEWTLPSLRIRLSETNEFAVRGRIDLVLARETNAAETFPFREAWIIDYKTGRRTSLAPGRNARDPAQDFRTKLLEGKGVQLAVYALALHALGAQEIGASLLTRELELERPQITFPVIEAARDVWLEFARLSGSGIFGMRGELRAEFQFQKDYPLATLGFDPDFLEEKWNVTHPGLPKVEKR